MKRTITIALSLLFVWTQVTLAAFSSSKTNRGDQPCSCCDCGLMFCCGSDNPESSEPLATPVRSITAQDLLPQFVTSQLWTLPEARTALSHTDIFYSPGSGVPLFTRHCALLI